MLDIILMGSDKKKTFKVLDSILSNSAYKKGQVTVYYMDFLGNKKIKDELVYKNVKYYNVGDKSEQEVYNMGLKESKGDMISFVTAECIYREKALRRAIKALESKDTDIVSLMPTYINKEGLELPYIGFEVVFNKAGEFKVDLENFPGKFHICFSAFVFKKSVLKNCVFDENLVYDSELKVLLEVLDKYKKYTIVNGVFLNNTPDERDYFNFQPQFDKEWYVGVMDNFFKNAINEGASKFRQRFVMYMIICRYACNLNERDKSILSPKEVERFIEDTGEAIKNIDDVIICDNAINYKFCIPKFFGLNLLRMKYKDNELMPTVISSGRSLAAYYNECSIWSLNETKVEIKSIYFDGKNLIIDGFFLGAYIFNEDDIEVFAMLNQNKEYPVRKNNIYSLNKVFNISAKKDYTFCFSMPEADMEDNMSISFYLKYKGSSYPLGCTFVRAMTKISGLKGSYWVFGKHILFYDSKTTSFYIEKLTRRNHIRHEIEFIKKIASVTRGSWRIKMVGNRFLFWFSKPFYSRKKIWITMDKLFKAGDNGEYFYEYVKKMKPKGVKIYYAVQKDSPDYKRLKKKYNTIVRFNSIHHKMLSLHTDLVLATHVDTMHSNGYYKATQRYFKDLYNARVVCLAHGLTIQKIAQYQNRVFDNTVLYFFASKYEVQNVSHPIYDYYDKDALQLTGHARYDGLISNDKKIILITPTWRRGITTGTAKKGTTYTHSDSFKNSEYYKIYNGLISDKRFIENAKKNGYRIVYLLHPAMSSQLQDFDQQDGVEVVAATSDISYEKILTESSLMVTDYSGVQFDFAYMKKPLVYYHPEALPPQYEEGGLKYNTMGFGPVCVNHEQIVDTLCKYMDNNCEMEDMYKARVDDFFEYDDHNNCERIYEKVIEFQNKFGKVNKYKYD